MEIRELETISLGAEARISLAEFLGRKVILKNRIPKRYRIRELDERLRYYRTREEAKIISDARRAGVPTPVVLHADKDLLVMEYIEGERLKDILGGENSVEIMRELGKLIGRLHSTGIIHGDLTPSNIIVSSGKLYLIDFGLGMYSTRAEDKAVDIHTLRESLRSTHPDLAEELIEAFLEGYGETCSDFDDVRERLEDIERRGRYVRR